MESGEKRSAPNTTTQNRDSYELAKHNPNAVERLDIRASVVKRLQRPSAGAVFALVYTNYPPLAQFCSVFKSLLTAVVPQALIMAHDFQALSSERLAVGVGECEGLETRNFAGLAVEGGGGDEVTGESWGGEGGADGGEKWQEGELHGCG